MRDLLLSFYGDDFTGSTDVMEALATNGVKTVLFTLTFKNLGIFKLTPEKVEAGSENIRRVKAEMYCEDMSFAYGGGSAWV